MGIDVVIKIAGVGILVAISCQLLKQTGRDDVAMIVGIAGIVLALMMVMSYVSSLIESVKTIFGL
ncbi:MAG: stage III sporulation protein AC [Clostridia bacterium]|nr:stage III sporulation protein AC [Clostridia bacterium]